MSQTPAPTIMLIAIPGIPMIQPGNDLAAIIVEQAQAAGIALEQDDVVVITHKIVSKAEGRAVRLSQVTPSPEAVEVAALVHKDPRLVEIILRESRGIVAMRRDLLVVENNLGLICANAGIDRSNIEHMDDDTTLMPLPQDPDTSARAIRERLQSLTGRRLAVLIIDTLGRPFREGVIGMTIGIAGLHPLMDVRGQHDLFGYVMEHTVINRADEIAASASMLMGQTDERRPVVIVRGAPYSRGEGSFRQMLREPAKDLFRPAGYVHPGKRPA
jgi:coenzyme F420-0:L-glutamate ligase/coenzyme F420-1:gamma-L-glutamate ligase